MIIFKANNIENCFCKHCHFIFLKERNMSRVSLKSSLLTIRKSNGIYNLYLITKFSDFFKKSATVASINFDCKTLCVFHFRRE